MAHYAFLDNDSIVTEVIPGRDEDDLAPLPEGYANWEQYYGEKRGQVCKRTSYNGNYRKNYAGVGYTFRADLNAPDGAFIAPQPYPSWTLNTDTCLWEPPVPYPLGEERDWNEDLQQWV